MKNYVNLNIFQLRSLNIRVTIFSLAIFLIGIWSLAFYASRILREYMQRMFGEQRFSKVSYVATEDNQAMEDQLSALETVTIGVSPTLLGNMVAMQAFLEQRHIFQSLFNGGTFATRVNGTTTASTPISAGWYGVNYMDRDCFPFATHHYIICAEYPYRRLPGCFINKSR